MAAAPPALDEKMKNRIKVLRAEKDWSQAELADLGAVSEETDLAAFADAVRDERQGTDHGRSGRDRRARQLAHRDPVVVVDQRLAERVREGGDEP